VIAWQQEFITFASAISAIALNALWQDALLVLSVWLMLRLWPRVNAATRYTVWIATLIAAFVIPVATTLAFFAPATPLDRPATHLTSSTAREHPALPSLRRESAVLPRPPVTLSAPAPRLPERFHLTIPVPVALAVFALWVLFAAYALVRLAIGLLRLEQLKRDALPLPVEYRDAMPQWLRANKGARDVRLCVSDETDVPVAVGLFDAMILVPRSLLDRLSEPEVDQICLHELAHLRRADDWTNGLQRLINALLGWNPAAQFVGQQLDLEREVACDDWVLSFVKTVRPYALCLTKMAETASWPRQPIPAPGVFATRKHISLRIERLLGAGRNIATNLSFAPAAAAVGIVGAIALVIALVAPSVAAPCITSITVVTNEKPVPAVPASKPAKVIYIQSKDVSVPATHVSLPATHVTVPETHVTVPEKHVTVPETRVTVPETHVTVPATHVNVPETTLTLPATHLALPGAQVTMPKMRIPLPHLDVSGLNTEVSREIDRSMSVAQAAAAASGSSRSCADCDFRNVDWSGKDMRGVSYAGTDLSGAKLVGTNFSSGKFDGVDFRRADLRNASFRGAHLTGCDFSEANLYGVDFTGAKITGCEFTRARLTSAELRDVLNTCTGCEFSHANLSGVNLSGIRASGIDFTGADLRGVNFAGAQLTGIDFTKAQMDGANLAGATLSGCDMSGVDLTHVDLSRTKLIGMDLTDQKHPR
jgi:uncharacterized protein YjbI with pentapeptide repeats/beta-lactamase regulating signal transducer with metallopeptidase domain